MSILPEELVFAINVLSGFTLSPFVIMLSILQALQNPDKYSPFYKSVQTAAQILLGYVLRQLINSQ